MPLTDSVQKEISEEKVLFMSDLHIGALISTIHLYQKNLIEIIKQYPRIVMIGDNWELFYVGKDHVKIMSNLLQLLTGKNSKEWEKEFEKRNFKDFDELDSDSFLKSLINKGKMHSATENVITGAELFTSAFLECFEDKKLYVVGGNHESLHRFHKKFQALQETYPNFEWSPEAIQVGDAIATIHICNCVTCLMINIRSCD